MHIPLTFQALALLLSAGLFIACNTRQSPAQAKAQLTAQNEQQTPGYFVNAAGDTIHQLMKTAEEWKSELTEQEFYVLRQAGTERAFSGDLWDNKEEGTYTCAACGLPLFESSTKFKSGTGWPSYYQPIDPAHIIEHEDRSHGMVRTEVVCARCQGHLGHVFPDGPRPTGLRYCINSVSLDFEADKP